MHIARLFANESNHIDRLREPKTMGVPIAKGLLFDASGLALSFADKTLLPIQVEVLARWADNSIRWLLIDFQLTLKAGSTSSFDLIKTDAQQPPAIIPSLEVNRADNKITVHSTESIFSIDLSGPALLSYRPRNSVCTDPEADISPILTDSKGTTYKAVIDSVSLPETRQPTRTTLTLSGRFLANQTPLKLIEFEAQLTFFAESSRVIIAFTLMNKNRAVHPGGLWDLGDPGSFLFKSSELFINHPTSQGIFWQSHESSPLQRTDNNCFSIYQESSGGDHWQGAAHKNRHGIVPFQIKGYQCTADNALLEEGLRASPMIYREFPAKRYGIYIEGFWQNFPTAIVAVKQSISLKLFPDTHPDCHELQGGEQKTHICHIDFNAPDHGFDWLRRPLTITLPPDYYIETQAFPYLSNINGILSPFIQAGLNGTNNFYAKREIADEYGWRHFGDLHADHETWNYQGDGTLVSHYNNQYDPIYGFMRQYVLSGQHAWFELMDDLAKHVVDIDIYHTELDKSEYNGGLFWHTNHYLDAHTSTHRTFSKHHPDVTADGPSGGGPGSEHCYTTGLLYHYYLTGSENSKNSLMSLIDWSIRLHKLPDTMLGKLNVLASKGIPLLKRVLKGEVISNRSYAFTRATGNFVSTLADAYHLTDDPKYLEFIDSILRKTFHPEDNIKDRKLDDIEYTWSYTVFLQSVSKFIDIKTEREEFDHAFHYARDAFLHYSHWMLENETTFLSKPEKLDYVNHTWVAQEVRKANLFCLAYKYCGATNNEYLERAKYFYNYVAKELKDHPESSYTRIIVILMQNQGIAEYFQKEHDFSRFTGLPSIKHTALTTLSLKDLINIFLRQTWQGLRNFSATKEIEWLRLRFK